MFFQCVVRKPTNLIRLSEGGYPQQSVYLYKNTVSSETRLTGAIKVETNNERHDVTNTLTFAPTHDDDGVLFICQPSYSEQPRLIK